MITPGLLDSPFAIIKLRDSSNLPMSIVKDIINNFRTTPKMETNLIGAPSFRYKNPAFLDCYDSDTYASIYPSVKAISNEFMKIRPFAIDAKGNKKENVTAINALYHPNQSDSAVAFREKLAVMTLTHRMTYVLVWRREGRETFPGGNLTPANIGGFTFLENPSITKRDGRTYYNIGAQQFSQDEVMVIPGGVDPNGLYIGYAPGISSHRWATLDEYIADFQKGFFENGAVPAGQFVVTAGSKQDYEDTVDKLQEAHRGAGKNNNVTYTPRPTDPATGKPADAKIEWIPFAQSNKDIDFKSLFEQANNRIDSTFGVPASIRGVGENNNYATARMDQQNFIRFTIEPLALRLFDQITHELNRITNGLGVAITFELEYPAVAEEELVQAETKKVEVETMLALTDKGFSLDSVIDALSLSVEYKKLSVGGVNTKPEVDTPDVDEGGEVEESPDPSKIDGVTPVNEAAKSPNPKAEAADEKKIYAVALSFMESQVDKAVEQFDEENPSNEVSGDFDEAELVKFTDEMMKIVTSIAVIEGSLQLSEGLDLLTKAGISVDEVTDFKLTEDQLSEYRSYLMRVGRSYGNDTQAAIRSILDKANTEGLSAGQIRTQLNQLPEVQGWRAERIARTETVRAEGQGSLYAMENIQTQTGVTLNKVWNVSDGSDPCEYCRAMNGTEKPVDQSFITVGGTIEGVDGGMLINDFVDVEVASAHPNCSCYLTYEVVS